MRIIAFALQLLVAMVMTNCVAPTEENSERDFTPYEEAQFTFSDDPTKAVLTVTTSSMDISVQSLILYGDGRMELKDNRKGEWIRHIYADEMQSILSTAVVHGLAEWDEEKILTRQLQKYGTPFPGFTDATKIRILLSLENYERGSYKSKEIFRSISVKAPSMVLEYYPEIVEFDGAAKVIAWMHGHITDLPYRTAVFDISNDPAKAVLKVKSTGSMTGSSRSMTVYGNGRVELERSARGGVGKVTKHLDIGARGLRDVVAKAVTTGVAEWNSDTIHAEMLKKTGSIPRITDADRIQITLSLKSYTRGSYTRKKPSWVRFTTQSPHDYAQWYPEIPQFKGVHQLVQFMQDSWSEATESEQEQ